jgi:hypothetical protein
MFHIVRWMDWEHDAKYTVSDMITYELSLIIQDAVLFFVVGRLYILPSVDHLAWIESRPIFTAATLRPVSTVFCNLCTKCTARGRSSSGRSRAWRSRSWLPSRRPARAQAVRTGVWLMKGLKSPLHSSY